MEEIIIQKAEEKDWPYIKEKLEKYILNGDSTQWSQFFVARFEGKTVAFARIIDRGEYFELASLGVDYYHRRKGIGFKMLLFLMEEARRMDPDKEMYGVTHRPGFLKKAGFEELSDGPEALKEKRQTKCHDPSKAKIMKYTGES